MTSSAEGLLHKVCGFATADSFAATFMSVIELTSIVKYKQRRCQFFQSNMKTNKSNTTSRPLSGSSLTTIYWCSQQTCQSLRQCLNRITIEAQLLRVCFDKLNLSLLVLWSDHLSKLVWSYLHSFP